VTNGHVPEPVVYLLFVTVTCAAAPPLSRRASQSIGITTPAGSFDYLSVAAAAGVAAAAAAAVAVGARWAA